MAMPKGRPVIVIVTIMTSMTISACSERNVIYLPPGQISSRHFGPKSCLSRQIACTVNPNRKRR